MMNCVLRGVCLGRSPTQDSPDLQWPLSRYGWLVNTGRNLNAVKENVPQGLGKSLRSRSGNCLQVID